MRQSVPLPMEAWPTLRFRETYDHYRRRAWRWGRVIAEYRPGVVRPARGRRRVLVVRLDAIGDFVLWSGAARVLRDWLGADTHVTLAANSAWADLARDADVFDEVWPVRRSRLEWDSSYRSQLRARVSGGRFSMAINPRYTREMIFGDSLMRWSRAPERIGCVGQGDLLPMRERRIADRWYTRLLPSSPEPMHETERNAEFLHELGVPLEGVPAPSLHVFHRPLEGLDDLANGYFVVFPGASLADKRWSPGQFGVVARHVQRETGWTPVLMGDRGDAGLTRAVAAEVEGAIDLAGETSVPVLASAIQRSRMVLTNDTSAVHIAVATGVPAVCVVGGWHGRRFVPYPASLPSIAERLEVVSLEDEMTCFNCGARCIIPHAAGEALPCVSRVPLSRVIGAVDRLLSRVMVTEPNG